MKVRRRCANLATGLLVFMAGIVCAPVSGLAALHDNGNGTVSASVTGLMWQQGDTQNGSGRNWEDALDYCVALTLPSGGYTDWRLPNARELESIVDWDRYNLTIDTAYFPDCRSSEYWSSSTDAHDSSYAWRVDFYSGTVYLETKTNNNYVRCVRGGPGGSFDYSVISLSCDPNPTTSEVMAGGKAYRYYLVNDSQDTPVSGATAKIEYPGGHVTSAPTDQDGILTVALEAEDLGEPDAQVACAVTEVNGVPINPVTFNISILPRESTLSFKIGSGINVGAAIGIGVKVGTERGLSYEVINTQPDLDITADDKIGVKRSREAEAGVYVEAGVGAGFEGSAYAGVEAELGISALLSETNDYFFDNPYGSDQKILRAGLILTSLFQGPNIGVPFMNTLLDWLIDSHNGLFVEYKSGETSSLGVKVYGSASAGAALGIGDADDLLMGIGIGAGIEGYAQLMGLLIRAYEYSGGLQETGSGAGVSFSGGLGLDAAVGIGTVGETVGAGIHGSLAGKYAIVLYSDDAGNLSSCEFVFSGTKGWGVSLNGELSGDTGSTSTTTLVVKGEDLISLKNEIADILNISNYMKGSASETIALGPTRLKQEIADLFNKLNTMTITYRIEEDKGNAFEFSPSIEPGVGAGAKIEVKVGVKIALEQAVSYLKGEGTICGVFGNGFPLTSYEYDGYIPAPDSIGFSDIVKDAGDGVYTAAREAGKIVKETVQRVGDVLMVIIKWQSKMFWIRSAKPNSKTVHAVLRAPAGLAETQPAKFGIGGVFLFSPEDVKIKDLSSGIASSTSVTSDNAEIVIEPGASSALMTITYGDGEVTGINEADLILFRWDNANKLWAPAEGSQVDTLNNKVTAWIDQLGTFTAGIPLPQGDVILNLVPTDIDINSPSNIAVSSEPIKLSTGSAVPDGTLVTLYTLRRYTTEMIPFGTINSQDEDAGTAGIQISTHGGTVSFSVSPPDEEGSGVILVSTVEGAAQGKAYFNIVADLDRDGNGLPDYWETAYFGATGQDPSDDSDEDGLTNLQEYQNGTDPTKLDTDGDGMPDGWEVENNLNPLIDDANADPDHDSFTNLEEYQAGTDPNHPDSVPDAGVLQFSITAYSVNENDAQAKATITVTRTGGSEGIVSVDYAASDGSATAGNDYTAVSGTLQWADGVSASKTFDVPILDDSIAEGDETVNLSISNPTGGASLGSPNMAVLTIVDAELVPSPGGIPDTGQTESYTETFGEDSDYLVNPPSYTKLDANGDDLPDSATSWVMVRDNVTGLIWEVKTNDGSVHDKDNTYTWYDGNPGTNGGDAGTAGDGTDTEDFINALNAASFGGYADWRVPSSKELASITDLGRYNPGINTDYFPNTGSTAYWSSTPCALYASHAWFVYFINGYTYYYPKSNSFSARAVRGGQTALLDHFVINGDDTVTDTVTGLMWQQATDGSMTWEAAISHCQTLSTGGYEDWRLPNSTELGTIVDYSTYNPAINNAVFPGSVSSGYWSSTTQSEDTISAWGIGFYSGGAYGISKPLSTYVRAVRGGQARLFEHLVILSPGQASRWDAGSSMPITWHTKEINGQVKISISRQGGKPGTFESIVETTENDGIYNWSVEGEGSVNCMLKVEPLADLSKGTTQGLFTIIAAIEAGTLQFDATTYSVGESGGTSLITVTRTGGSNGAVSVDYASSNGSATAGSDYTAVSGTLNWNDGETASKTFNVPILDDTNVEGNETVNLSISNSTGGASLGSPNTAVLTIVDAELVPSPGGIPDTGQTESYTETFGEDSDYLINPPSYTKLDANGNDLSDSATSWVMVRDNVTGLIWEVKTDDDSVHDRDNTYTWYDSNPETNGGDAGTAGDGTDTEDFINALNAANFGGYTDWRLPSIKELSSIVDLGRYDPGINTDYFPNTLSRCYRSSTTFAYSIGDAWGIYFTGGSDGNYSKSTGYYVRAVRGGQTGSLDHFVINDDGTVTDTATGLMWQQATDGSMNWEAAISHCETLSLAGYEDWRLPNHRELRTIVDYSTYGPAIDIAVFPGSLSSHYWSSTTNANNTGLAWFIHFITGHGGDYRYKSNSHYVRAVRGGQARLFGHLVILSPGQASRWDAGSSMPITWDTKLIDGQVRMSISRQGGKPGTFESIVESTENDGIYNWSVEGGGSVNCMLKIEPLADPSKGTTQGLFTIQAALETGSLQFDVATYLVGESGGTRLITVTRTGGSDGAVSVDYAASDGSATAGSDYTAVSGTLQWADGDSTTKTFYVPILDDSIAEGDETVSLSLSNATGGASIGSPKTAVLTITDDDVSTIIYVGPGGACLNNSPCYSTIQGGINAANGGCIIKVAEGSYDGDLVLGESKEISLEGGLGSTFNDVSGRSKIVGSLTVRGGTITLKKGCFGIEGTGE